MEKTIPYTSLGYITSPYYPSFYINNVKRTWKLEAPIGMKITIHFLYINIEESPECDLDYVAIKDDFSTKKMSRHCGSHPPPDITSHSNVLTVIFVANKEYVGTGFKIRYTKQGMK